MSSTSSLKGLQESKAPANTVFKVKHTANKASHICMLIIKHEPKTDHNVHPEDHTQPSFVHEQTCVTEQESNGGLTF